MKTKEKEKYSPQVTIKSNHSPLTPIMAEIVLQIMARIVV